MNKIICPSCRSDKIKITSSFKTQNKFPPIINNGININPDGNRDKFTCVCQNCKESFIALYENGDYEVKKRND